MNDSALPIELSLFELDPLESEVLIKWGVMDKLVANFEFTFSCGQNGCCFFDLSFEVYFHLFIFGLSSKTEVGSAGEQPTRD